MGAIDAEAKAYLSDPERFADAFNFSVYDGDEVIKAKDLKELDTAAIAMPYGVEAKAAVQKYRDLIRLYAAMQDGRAIYIVLGLELQTLVHYAMPVRGMLYDALNYPRQVTEAAVSYRKEPDSRYRHRMSSGEYLSGFRKGDRLMPVITLTISLSADPWDGPIRLHEMLALDDARLLQFVPDYKLNLLAPQQIAEEDFGKFRTGLGSVLQFAKHSNDENADWMAGNKNFEKLDWDTASMIKTFTGADIKMKRGESVNMWKAWENGIKQARSDGYNVGKNDGRIDGYNVGRSDGRIDTAITVAEKYNIPAEEILKAVGVSQADWDAYARDRKITQ